MFCLVAGTLVAVFAGFGVAVFRGGDLAFLVFVGGLPNWVFGRSLRGCAVWACTGMENMLMAMSNPSNRRSGVSFDVFIFISGRNKL